MNKNSKGFVITIIAIIIILFLEVYKVPVWYHLPELFRGAILLLCGELLIWKYSVCE